MVEISRVVIMRPLITGVLTLAAFIGFIWLDYVARSEPDPPRSPIGFSVFMTPLTMSTLSAATSGTLWGASKPEWSVSMTMNSVIDDTWKAPPAETSMALVTFGRAVSPSDQGPFRAPALLKVSLKDDLDFVIYVYGKSATPDPANPQTVTTFDVQGIGKGDCAAFTSPDGSEVRVKFKVLKGDGGWPDRYWCHIPAQGKASYVRIALFLNLTSPSFGRDIGGRSIQEYVYPEDIVTLTGESDRADSAITAATTPAPVTLAVTPETGASLDISPSPVLRADSKTSEWRLDPSGSVVVASSVPGRTLLITAFSQFLLLGSGVGLGLIPGYMTKRG